MNRQFGTTAMRVAALLAFSAGMAGPSSASPVTVDGTFLSFTSWMLDPTVRTSFVNGIELTSSGIVAGTFRGNTYFMSKPVVFPTETPTTNIDFTYAAAGFTPPNPFPNAFTFTAAPEADVIVGETFQLGTFTYTNGQWFPEADIRFSLITSSRRDLALNGQSFLGTLHLVATEPGIFPFVPDAEADYFYVLERPDLGSARVYEQNRQPPGNPGNVGSFAFNGRIGSLIPTGFVALDSAGFTNSSILPALDPVPEAETYAMLLAGLGLLGFMARRRRKLPTACRT